MRQAVRTLILGGVLFSVAACGTANNPSPGAGGVGIGSATAPAGGATEAAAPSIRSACEALGQVYSKNMVPVAEALTKVVDEGGDKAVRKQAQQALDAFAAEISRATAKSADPELRNDGERTAARVRTEAADADLFKKIKTNADVNTMLGDTLREWLSPVDQHCN
jgi:hypothetical protein